MKKERRRRLYILEDLIPASNLLSTQYTHAHSIIYHHHPRHMSYTYCYAPTTQDHKSKKKNSNYPKCALIIACEEGKQTILAGIYLIIVIIITPLPMKFHLKKNWRENFCRLHGATFTASTPKRLPGGYQSIYPLLRERR